MPRRIRLAEGADYIDQILEDEEDSDAESDTPDTQTAPPDNPCRRTDEQAKP